MLVKICGVTNLKDAGICYELGAEMVGFNFFRSSKRYIEPAYAAKVIRQTTKMVTKVGIFVNPTLSELQEIIALTGIEIVQLHGSEPPEFCQQLSLPVIKAIPLRDENDLLTIEKYSKVTSYILVDSATAGSGKLVDLSLSSKAAQIARVILAGGLTPTNISQIASQVKPIGVDVATGVEDANGAKSPAKITAFIQQIKQGV
jgi:phosphoribosylanthranilate isomerase